MRKLRNKHGPRISVHRAFAHPAHIDPLYCVIDESPAQANKQTLNALIRQYAVKRPPK